MLRDVQLHLLVGPFIPLTAPRAVMDARKSLGVTNAHSVVLDVA